MPVTKKALKRDNSVPAGTAAPMHVDCECGKPVPITEEFYNECENCGCAYNAAGWIVATLSNGDGTGVTLEAPTRGEITDALNKSPELQSLLLLLGEFFAWQEKMRIKWGPEADCFACATFKDKDGNRVHRPDCKIEGIRCAMVWLKKEMRKP